MINQAALIKVETPVAYALATNTEYGPAVYFYSRDIGRCWWVAEALEYGIAGINEGIEKYVEVKYLCMGGVRASLPRYPTLRAANSRHWQPCCRIEGLWPDRPCPGNPSACNS